MDTKKRVLKAKNKVNSALKTFKVISNVLTEASAELVQSIEEDKKKIAELQENINQAENSLKFNNALKVKLDEFISE